MSGTYEDANGLVIERRADSMIVHLKKADTEEGDGLNHIHGYIEFFGTKATSLSDYDKVEEPFDGIKEFKAGKDELDIKDNGKKVAFWLTTGKDEDTFTINLDDYTICDNNDDGGGDDGDDTGGDDNGDGGSGGSGGSSGSRRSSGSSDEGEVLGDFTDGSTEGEVLGANTLAATGTNEMNSIFLGFAMILSVILIRKTSLVK